jgi:type IV pilus modification protein PilV
MKAGFLHRPINQRKASGFTMIEMLIAMVILVIGLLAVGLLQLRGMAMTRDANMRTSAIFAANALADAIRANYGVNYELAPTNSVPTGAIAAASGCKYTMSPSVLKNLIPSNPSIDCACGRRDADFEHAFDSIQNLPNPLAGGRITILRQARIGGGVGVPVHFIAPQSCSAALGTAYMITVRWSEGTGAIGIQDQFVEVQVMP